MEGLQRPRYQHCRQPSLTATARQPSCPERQESTVGAVGQWINPHWHPHHHERVSRAVTSRQVSTSPNWIPTITMSVRRCSPPRPPHSLSPRQRPPDADIAARVPSSGKLHTSLSPRAGQERYRYGTGLPTTSSVLFKRHVQGLRNFGNTCYCNCILQALLSCQDFIATWLRSSLTPQQTISNPHSEYGGQLLKTWHAFIVEAYSSRKQTSSRHLSIINLIRQHNPQFRYQTEADAHEFFQVLLKALSTEMHIPLDMASTTATESSDHFDKEVASATFEAQQKCELNSPVETMWRSQFVSEIKCVACRNVRYRFESEYDWDLEVPLDAPSNEPISLQRLMADSVNKVHHLELHCSKCNAITRSEVRRRPYKLPQNYLCIQIKRFAYDRDTHRTYRLDTPVKWPTHSLDLSPFCAGPKCENQFVPCGVTLQRGSLLSGHYSGIHWVSAPRGEEGVSLDSQWYHFSDDQVWKANPHQHHPDGDAIYLLWFKRVHNYGRNALYI